MVRECIMVEVTLAVITADREASEAKDQEVSVEVQEVITEADQAGPVDLVEWEEDPGDLLVVEGLGNKVVRDTQRETPSQFSNEDKLVQLCPNMPNKILMKSFDNLITPFGGCSALMNYSSLMGTLQPSTSNPPLCTSSSTAVHCTPDTHTFPESHSVGTRVLAPHQAFPAVRTPSALQFVCQTHRIVHRIDRP